MAHIEFTIPGTPQGWRRATPIVRGKRAIMHNPPENVKFEKIIREHCREAMDDNPWLGCALKGAVKIEVLAVFAPSASWPAYKKRAALSGAMAHLTVPDCSNIVKLVEDALQPPRERPDGALEWPPHGKGYAYLDDSQITDSRCSKRYGTPARTIVRITPIGEE